VDTLSFGSLLLPNWSNESAEDLGHIRVYSGPLRGKRQDVGDETATDDSESLGGIPFGKMAALEAVSISVGFCKFTGSFCSLLRHPSLKLFKIGIESGVFDSVIGRVSEDVGGRRMHHLETLVVSVPCKRGFLKRLGPLLALFPNLKCLRISVDCASTNFGTGLGRLVRKHLRHLAEFVVDGKRYRYGDPVDIDDLYVETILRGLGRGWMHSRRCPRSTARFVAEGRDRAEYSSYFFDDDFFR
jgi:hypothetical protein